MKTSLPFMVFLLFHRHFSAALCLFALCLSALCLATPSVAAPVTSQRLSVGLYASAPFVEIDDGGRPFGMAIDIWREVEERLDNDFTQKWHEGLAINLNDLLIAARGGSLRPTYLGWLGYLLSSLWMLCGVPLVAYVTSTITSAMTTASLSYGISSFTDLPGKRIGVRSGSFAEAFLKRQHLRSVSFPTCRKRQKPCKPGRSTR